MCYEASQARKVKRLEEHYGVRRSEKFEISDTDFIAYHLRGLDHPEMLVIPQESKEELHPMIWGIMPSYKNGFQLNDYYQQGKNNVYSLNAQSEKIFTYDTYKDSILIKRCIIPVTGFFEPHSFMNTTYPFYFTDKVDGILSIAGIYTESADGMVRTFTMLTKKASNLFSTIHNKDPRGHRQVVLLNKDLQKEWLRCDLNKEHITELINLAYDDSTLEYYPVSRNLYSPKIESNSEYIIQKADYPELAFNMDLIGLI
ncbi:SOS response-associated peptidase [Aquimarina sp. 2201CG14-23]|uniref:SOS response-associated peptidase n=1 Tax=Aquimarina mycalae TaxID=3040073 RepID=UPI0024781B31|nr:SOS response-associated peptidase family protein [Aquimarina sp. 2201CG14-23]MDH7444667.1 SOS response-associated peptidase family protein [Aquimarina sp. 2201CG14-23]